MFDVTKAQLLRNWEGWSQISSSCVWMGFFLLLNLVFIGTTSVNSLLKNVSISSKKKNVTLNEEQQQCPTTKYQRGNITLGISYQVSKLCSLIVLVSHLVRQSLLLLQEYRRNCNYMLSVLAEVTQVVSWIVMSVAILSFHKATSVKLPCVIRIWWISCFFQSVISIKYKVQSIIRHEDLIGAEEYTTLLSLLSCGYLSAVSFRGTTGISFTRSTATEPLLHASLNKQEEKESQSLYGEASLQQLVTFSWLSPLFVLGKRKPLDQSDVPDIDIKETAEFSSNLFDNDLKHVKEIYNSSQNMSIYITIFIFIRKKVAVNACFALLCASASFVGPSLIYNFVEFLNGRDHGLKTGYLLALAFVSAKFVETISHGQWAFGARLLGLRLKAALISHIYKKGLHLSNQSRRYHSSGEIINYMSVDIERVIKVIWHANILLKLPVQISLAIYVLHKNLGLGSIAGLAATLMVITCNIPITRTQKRFQSKIMESKDARMKATSEVLRNMRILKLQAWDTQYLNKLETLRNVEYGWLWKSLKLQALSALVFWGAPTFISVVTFGACILMGIPLTAGRVLSALATFQMLQDPIFSLPELLRVMAEAKVSTDRLAAYLQEEEMKSDAVEIIPRNETRLDIEIDDGIFSWDGDNESPTLTDVQLNVQKGMKVAICGTTGSGKSSLVSSILGEIPKVGGRVKVCGSKAYVAQTPWILSGNVRENILFGNQYDSERYERIIEACALIEDFELFPSGDLTEIGERGINMSGGQKQRIQIARAVYQDADVYLLDDPFSAVDAHTGTHLFKVCLMGILKDKTILYVTHQVEFLPAADLILVMQNGKIAQAGKYDELLSQNIGFEVLVGAHNEALESILSAESSSRALPKDEQRIRETSNESERKTEKIVDPQSQSINKQESQKCTSEDIANRGKLTKDEERERGSISKTVYWAYLTAVHHGVFVPIIIIAQCLFQILQVSSNYWMTWASPATSASEPIIGMTVLFSVYILLSVGSSLCVFARAILVVTAGLLTSQKVFKDMLRCLIRAPMSFFDSTPTGRILNRASTDQSVLDLDIAGNLGSFALSLTGITGTIIVMSQVAWPIFVLFVLVAAISIWYQRYYIATSRELSRLSGIQRAPILHHFAESLSGAATIRAFGQEDRFINANLSLIDNHSKPRLHYVTAMEWLSLRINVLSLFVFAFSLILLVSLPEGFINPSIAGLAVTYGLNLSSQLASIIWSMSDTENQMISVERILQYSRIQNEAPLLIEKCRPPNHWPEIGTINFKNLQVRYAEHLPSVLQNITCTIPGGKRVGVVGRTGSGKSTLIQALFRIVEPREGTIEIDGVDICKIGLHDLRSRLSIIPQDPTMFEGTVRGNLDPLKEYSDQRIWEASSRKCQLSELIQQNEKKLDLPVAENGENWSVGQRQLFCLGRALLKRSSILVLDEATASLDSATDEIIQKTIRQEFEYCTVVTIAHRIHTVIDSNLILVLSEGRVHEYDTPAKLLEREDSAFSKLIKEYSMRSHYSLTNI